MTLRPSECWSDGRSGRIVLAFGSAPSVVGLENAGLAPSCSRRRRRLPLALAVFARRPKKRGPFQLTPVIFRAMVERLS